MYRFFWCFRLRLKNLSRKSARYLAFILVWFSAGVRASPLSAYIKARSPARPGIHQPKKPGYFVGIDWHSLVWFSGRLSSSPIFGPVYGDRVWSACSGSEDDRKWFSQTREPGCFVYLQLAASWSADLISIHWFGFPAGCPSIPIFGPVYGDRVWSA